MGSSCGSHAYLDYHFWTCFLYFAVFISCSLGSNLSLLPFLFLYELLFLSSLERGGSVPWAFLCFGFLVELWGVLSPFPRCAIRSHFLPLACASEPLALISCGGGEREALDSLSPRTSSPPEPSSTYLIKLGFRPWARNNNPGRPERTRVCWGRWRGEGLFRSAAQSSRVQYSVDREKRRGI